MITVIKNIHNTFLNLQAQYTNWAIYGTGEGAEKLWKELEKLNLLENIKCVMDNEEKICNGLTFHGNKVKGLSELPSYIDVIFIGAEINHIIVEQKIKDFLQMVKNDKILVVNPFWTDVTFEGRLDYLKYIESPKNQDNFVPMCDDNYQYMPGDSKVIAWFLPQFHQIELNNKYHGMGFTEWTNTSQTLPQFKGHYQPHIPYDVGYYDLMNPQTLKRQGLLAKKYGIYGFGFFYYWFSGKRIMEKPLQMLLDHKEIDINFCVHWATDDWSMSWYGGENKVVLKQTIPVAVDFWKDIAPLFEDKRYIKIDGKPLLVIYKCNVFNRSDFIEFIRQFRKLVRQAGYPDVYVMLSTGDGTFENVDHWAGDALVEYQPWKLFQSELIEKVLPEGYINPNFRGNIISLQKVLRNKAYLSDYKCKKFFRSAMVSWDNSARKRESNAIVMLDNAPENMKQWLIDIMLESRKIHSPEENFVFLSSWNEWAEGSHLEPDYKYGYAWLQAVKEAHELCREK